MEMTVSECAAGGVAAKITFLSNYKNIRKNGIQDMLLQRAIECYGEAGAKSILNNTISRLLLKYDCLGYDSQVSMYGFTKGYICRAMNKTLDRRELLSATLGMGNTAAWEAIEKFTDQLMQAKRIH